MPSGAVRFRSKPNFPDRGIVPPFSLPVDRRAVAYTNATYASATIDPIVSVRYTLDHHDRLWLDALYSQDPVAAQQLTVPRVEAYITALEVAAVEHPALSHARLDTLATSKLPDTAAASRGLGGGGILPAPWRELIRNYWCAKRAASAAGRCASNNASSASRGPVPVPAAASSVPLIPELALQQPAESAEGVAADVPFFSREIDADVWRQRAHALPGADEERAEALAAVAEFNHVALDLGDSLVRREVLKWHRDIATLYELAWLREPVAQTRGACRGLSQSLESEASPLPQTAKHGGAPPTSPALEGLLSPELLSRLAAPVTQNVARRLVKWLEIHQRLQTPN